MRGKRCTEQRAGGGLRGRTLRWAVGTGLGLTVVAVGLISTWALAGSRSFQLFGTIVDRVETNDRVLALTFDDGPTPGATDSILGMLADAGVRATFFFTGSELAENTGLATRYLEAGHDLGNHSFSHQRMVFKGRGFIASEIETTDSLLREAGQRGPIHFRPPYGKKLVALPRYLSQTGRVTIMWDVEPDSYPEVASDRHAIVEDVRSRVRPGSIIILHVMYPSRGESLAAVPGIIDSLREEGFEFVTVSELLERSASIAAD